MSTDDAPEGEMPPTRSSGAPTWLLILLAVLLVLGLVCAGGVALVIYGFNSRIEAVSTEQVRAEMHALHEWIAQYQAENKAYPETLDDMGIGVGCYHDYRDKKGTPLVYLPPIANAAPTDLLAHTSRDGPLPILAIQFDGTDVEFDSPRKLDEALQKQSTRLPADPVPPSAPQP